jgi:hypothetical protein
LYVATLIYALTFTSQEIFTFNHIIFPIIANDQVRGEWKEEKSQYLSRTLGIMLQCQLFRFNVPSIICEVSEMKTVFRIKTLLPWNRFRSSPLQTRIKHVEIFFWQIAFISLHCHRLLSHTSTHPTHTQTSEKNPSCVISKIKVSKKRTRELFTLSWSACRHEMYQ